MRTQLIVLCTVFAAACNGADLDVDVEEGQGDVALDAKVDSPAGLTKTQSKTTLETIDRICGDAWCEGDYNWSMEKIRCDFDAKTCTLTVSTEVQMNDGADDWYQTFYRSCKMKGLAKYGDLIEKSGKWSYLTDKFQDKLDGCFSKMSSSVEEASAGH